MFSFLLRRLLGGLAIIFMVVTLTFALVHAAPGEPFAGALDDRRTTPASRAALRERYGLDRPLPEQYLRFLAGVARGELGVSLSQERPVRDILAEALPRTLLLMGCALAVGFALGIGVGAAQATREGSLLDRLATRVTVVLTAIPDFWLALGLMLVFAVRLRWLPSAGMTTEGMHDYMTPAAQVADVARHLVLPVAALGLILTGVVARHQRAALLEVIPDDFVRTARAKGVPERAVLGRHALRNALLPVITLLGLALPALVGGSVFVETIFAWPGMGKVAVDALSQRDYPVVLGTALVASVVVVLSSVLADLLYAASDPRTRSG